MKRKLVVAFLAVMMVFGAFTSPALGATGWQTLGSWWYDLDGSVKYPHRKTSPIAISQDGGNIGIQVRKHYLASYSSYQQMQIRVYEDDGSSSVNPDDFIGTAFHDVNSAGSPIYTFNIAGHADGANGKAEIYFVLDGYYDSTGFSVGILD